MLNPNLGRVLSAVGACLLIVTLFVVWYDIDRSAAEGATTSTGWQFFPRLRVAVLLGAIGTLLTAIPRQTRPVLIARTLLGIAVGALIMRRIIDTPEISAPLHPQPGMYAALLGAILVAIGGLVDTGRRVAAAYPGLAGGGSAAKELPPGGPAGGSGATVRVPNESGGSGAMVRVPNEAERNR